MKIAHYQIEKELGRGGMGIVYKAYDTKLERVIALKVLLSRTLTQREVQRFILEAKATAKLKHPNIVEVYEIGSSPQNYFTMEYIEGETLSSIIKSNHCNIEQHTKIIKKIAEALYYAHKNGIIHRDIKPSNIILTKEGEPKIMDFGLVKVIEKDVKLSISGEMIGTPSYMSPEQADNKKVTNKSDIYSLGATFYEMLTQRPPFQGSSNYNIMYQIFENDPISPRLLNPDIPKDLENICMKCLHKKPQKRYFSSKAFARDIERYSEGKPVKARPISVFEKFQKLVMRNKKVVSILGVLFLTLAFIIYHFFLGPGYLTIEPHPKNNVLVYIDGVKVIGWKSIPIYQAKRIHVKVYAIDKKTGKILKDYEPSSFSELIGHGENFKKSINFAYKKGLVSIKSSLKDVKVTFIKQRKRKSHNITPLSTPVKHYLPIGKYKVIFEKKNHFPKTKEITIDSRTPYIERDIKLKSILIKKIEVSSKVYIKDMVVADINNDGELEVVIVMEDASLCVYKMKEFQLLWKLEQNTTIQKIGLYLKDINKDGILDFIIAHYNKFHIIDGKNHSEIFSRQSWYGETYILKDYNKDGYDDIILFRRMGNIECFDLRTGKCMARYKADWRINKYAPLLINDKYIVYGINRRLRFLNLETKATWDISEEKVTGRHDDVMNLIKLDKYRVVYSYLNKVICMNIRTSKVEWIFRSKKIRKRRYPTMFLSQTSQKNIIICLDKLYVLNSKTGKERISFVLDEHLEPLKPIGVDNNKDGEYEILIVGGERKGKGAVYFYNYKTQKIERTYFTDHVIKKYATVDNNKESKVELLIAHGRYIDSIVYEQMGHKNVIVKEDLHKPCFPSVHIIDGNKIAIMGEENKNITCFYGEYFEKRISHKFPSLLNFQVLSLKINGEQCFVIPTKHRLYIVKVQDILSPLFSIEKNTLWQWGDRSQNILSIHTNYVKNRLALFVQTEDVFYCIDIKKFQLIWKTKKESINCITHTKLFYTPKKHLQIIITGKKKNKNFVVLFNENGKELWRTETVYSLETRADIHVCDMNNDGTNEVIVGQNNGWVYFLSADTGKITWFKKFSGGSINGNILSLQGDFGKNQLFMTNRSGEILCIDSKNGKLLWKRKTGQNKAVATSISTTLLSKTRFFSKIIIATSYDHSLYICKPEDGKWIGNIDYMGVAIQYLSLDDSTNLFFVNENQFIYVTNIAKFLHKQFMNVYGFSSYARQNRFITLSLLHKYFLYRAYRKLKHAIQIHASFLKEWDYLLSFYMGTIYLSEKKFNRAESFMKQSLKQSNIFDAKFLLSFLYMKKGDDQKAIKLLSQLLEFPLEFDICYRKYEDFTGKLKTEKWKILLSLAIKKSSCDRKLHNAYNTFLLLGKRREADKLLPLTFKYGLKTTVGFKKRFKRYLWLLEREMNDDFVYRLHTILDKLNQAVANIPFSSVLYCQRAEFYIHSMGMFDKAKQDIKIAEKLDPKNSRIRYTKALIYYSRKEYDKALEQFRLYFKKHPTLRSYMYIVAILLMQGRKQEANIFIKNVKRQLPKKYRYWLRTQVK